jgi:hypothetical protein
LILAFNVLSTCGATLHWIVNRPSVRGANRAPRRVAGLGIARCTEETQTEMRSNQGTEFDTNTSFYHLKIA